MTLCNGLCKMIGCFICPLNCQNDNHKTFNDVEIGSEKRVHWDHNRWPYACRTILGQRCENEGRGQSPWPWDDWQCVGIWGSLRWSRTARPTAPARMPTSNHKHNYGYGDRHRCGHKGQYTLESTNLLQVSKRVNKHSDCLSFSATRWFLIKNSRNLLRRTVVISPKTLGIPDNVWQNTPGNRDQLQKNFGLEYKGKYVGTKGEYIGTRWDGWLITRIPLTALNEGAND